MFVVDGEPPELKWEAIVKRIQARNSGQNWRSKNPQKTVTGGCRVGRSHFAVWVREVGLHFNFETSLMKMMRNKGVCEFQSVNILVRNDQSICYFP